ncbi:MAG: glutamine--fructose-6-phosphate transaminase (isomerizing) [Chloroflexota bacterium]|nr:glutamine--fructose-6-phosphate transaminase (isomerizing) [Chloroflexota bacterium]
MCGIFGYTGQPINAADLVFSGLKTLEYRGYDSWGIAVGAGNQLYTARDTGKLGLVPTGLPDSGLAIGHTRWATTGAVTVANAHPQHDCAGRFALVHNGVIENYLLLREQLRRQGHSFVSDTDSEVAAHMLEEEFNLLGGSCDASLAEALRRVSLKLEGLNALAALDATSGQMAATKNGSPLIVGLGSGANYLASDQAALLGHTDRLLFVRDGETVALWPDRVAVYSNDTGAQIPLAIEEVHWRPDQASLNGYRHFLEKEIWEQPQLLRQIATTGMAQAATLARFIAGARKLYFVGCGTAYHAALMGSYLLAAEAGRSAIAAYPHEFATFAPLLEPGDALIALSQSGETIDVLEAVRDARARGVSVGTLTNVPGSTLTREADFNLMLGAGPEKSVLSTKTFTAKLAYLLLATGALAGEPMRHETTLLSAADEIDVLRQDDNGMPAAIKEVAVYMTGYRHMFVLGRGLGYPLALEAALKIKEISYLHTEGFAAGELKHGVIALIEEGTPVILFVPEGTTDKARMLTAAGEVKARGAHVIGISPENHPLFDMHLPVGGSGPAFYLAATVTAQRLAYELALVRGTDPDKPRNLAKSVTVR